MFENPAQLEHDFKSDKKLLIDINNNITVPALQFFKSWKTEYEGQEIVTYLEREWRYVPDVGVEHRLVTANDEKRVGAIVALQKPHLPRYALPFSELGDLRYIVIEQDKDRSRIFKGLAHKFGKGAVVDAMIRGELFILTGEQVRNNF